MVQGPVWVAISFICGTVAEGMMLGKLPEPRSVAGRRRVEEFLMGSLASATRQGYSRALDSFRQSLAEAGVDFDRLDEAAQDWFLAELVLDAYDEGDQERQAYARLVSALAKTDPRRKLKVVYRCLDVWARNEPVHQAPAVPVETITALSVLALLSGRPPIAVGMVVAFSGLLRIRELLQLRGRDVLFLPHAVVLILAVTKTGTEQKVVLTNAVTMFWLKMYYEWRAWSDDDLVFPFSYGTMMRHLQRVAVALLIGHLRLTTHTFRRSGASELARRGMPMLDIILFGRWQSESSAREYIRKGEAAVLRGPTLIGPVAWDRIQHWASMAPHVWSVFFILQATRVPVVVGKISGDHLTAWADIFSGLC